MLRIPKVEYLTPKTLEEACSLLALHQDSAKVIAGGTDLLIQLKRRLIKAPHYIIGLKIISDLNSIKYDEKDGLKIGALATLSSIGESAVVRKKYPVLTEAVSQFGATEVRNMGTVGGNLCNAAPSADTAPPLLALEAKVKLVSSGGSRTIPLEEFFTAPNESVLDAGEIMAEIQIPRQAPFTAGAFIKLTRTAMGLAVVNIAVVITTENHTIKEIKIALGACAPTPWRAKKAENIIRGRKITDDLIQQASRAASEESRPRSMPEYKKDIIEVFTKRALKKALARADGA